MICRRVALDEFYRMDSSTKRFNPQRCVWLLYGHQRAKPVSESRIDEWRKLKRLTVAYVEKVAINQQNESA